MMAENTNTEVSDTEMAALKAFAKADKYWTCSDAERETFNRIVSEMGIDLAKVTRKEYATHQDRDRLYLKMVGPSNLDAGVRTLALRLQAHGVKAHATAFLLGIPPKMIGSMVAAAKAAEAKPAETVAEDVTAA